MRFLLIVSVLVLVACATPTTRRLDAFPSPVTLHMSEDSMRFYHNAQEDFELIQAGSPPKHAREINRIRDGGSIFYSSEGYRLVAWHRMMNQDGKHGIWVGPEITFHRPISRIGKVSFTTASFQHLQNKK